MNPDLEGYTAALCEPVGSEEWAALAQELSAIEHLVLLNAELGSALSDTAVASASRRAVMNDLLEGRVSSTARRLASYAVSSVSATDVLGALNWLSHRVGLGESGTELALLGHLAARERIGGYATAVFEEAETPQLEEIEDQLFRFARIVEATPELSATLSDREVPVSARQGVVEALLNTKVEPATLRLVRFVVGGGRPRDFVGALDWLVEQTAQARGWRVAHVQAADQLDEAQSEHLADALAHLSGHPVELQVTLVPDLLGGVVVQIGDLRVDASARGRLERLREELLPAGTRRGVGRHDGARGDQ